MIITLRAEKGGESFRRRAIGKQSVKADGEDIRGESVGNQLGIDCESMGKTGNLQPLAAENSRSSSLENLLASHRGEFAAFQAAVNRELGFRASDDDAMRSGAFRRRIPIRRRKAPQALLS